MLQLSSPIWMYTSLAMVVPLLVHLWNVRKGKRLKIGSLLLITETIQKKARQIRVTEWLLLAVRCLLIFLLSLYLSGPVWKQEVAAEGKGWVLVAPEHSATLYRHFQPQIDSLLTQGYTFHSFDFPFDKTDPAGLYPKTIETGYWQRMAQLNRRLSKDFPVAIFSDGSVSRFYGNKPASHLNTTWKTMRADTPVTANADTALHITVYHTPAYAEDATYVSAALRALQASVPKRLVIFETTGVVTAGGQDWVFWLSDTPPAYTDTAAFYLRYANGKGKTVNSVLLSSSPQSAVQPPLLYQYINGAITGGTAVWRDGFGHTILDRDSAGHSLVLYTRFHPAWNNLVWDASFPEWLYNVMEGERDAHTTQQIDPSQLVFTNDNTDAAYHTSAETPLGKYIFWLMILCLLLERWLSTKRKRDAA